MIYFLVNDSTDKPISLKKRRNKNKVMDKKAPWEDNKKKDEVDTNINASLISNTSSIRMLVPPYQSPPGPGMKDNNREVKPISSMISNISAIGT